MTKGPDGAALQRAAVIDIGSNSIRYMEAVRTGHGLRFSKKQVYTTRLAEGLPATGALSEGRMTQSLEVLCTLAAPARASGLPAFAYATSAVRDAANRDLFVRCAAACTGIPVRVLSGAEEAAFARAGACGAGAGGLIDIGGGSTQIVTQAYRSSWPLGCVRLKELCAGATLADIRKRALPLLERTIAPPPLSAPCWTAVGGTATTLAALSLGLTEYDPAALTACRMDAAALEALLAHLDGLGGAGRRREPLLRERHDVILYGGTILSFVMALLGADELRFSDADGMEGYAAHLLRGDGAPRGEEIPSEGGAAHGAERAAAQDG